MRKEKIKLEKYSSNGITLIALVITIIVLLILAGVSIAMLTGENGVLTKATDAKNQTEIAQEKEEITMAYASAKANKVDKISENVSETELQSELDKLNSEGTTDETGELIVTYPNGHIYTIDQSSGTISGPDIIEENTATAPELWEKTTKSDSEWYSYEDVSNGNKKVNANAPRLNGAMTPIKYVGSDKDSQTGSKWANAITQDGSMWVWIPRFAYKITSGYHTNQAGTIQVAFIDTRNNFLNGESGTIVTDPSQVTYTDDGTGNQVQNEWLVHPAFTDTVENGGGFGNKTGFWIAKFEVTGTKESISVKPGESILVNMTINEQYKAGRNAKFNETQNLNGHMIKNSEWGATVYLAYSKYGTNGQKVEKINSSSSYVAGGSNTPSTIYTTNKSVTTTHNAYGVYGMNGGTWEFVASYVDYGDNMSSEDTTYGGYGEESLLGKDTAERAVSTEFKTVYQANGTSQAENYNLAQRQKGDAVYETSNNYSNYTDSWFSASAYFPVSIGVFFARGGSSGDSNAGTFGFGHSAGDDFNYFSFRIALVP